MSTTQSILAFCAALFLLLFMTGSTGVFREFIDSGVGVRNLPYVLALPGMAVFTLYMLKG